MIIVLQRLKVQPGLKDFATLSLNCNLSHRYFSLMCLQKPERMSSLWKKNDLTFAQINVIGANQQLEK